MGRARVDPAAMCVREAGGTMPFAIDWRARTATLDPAGAALPVRRLRWGEKRALAAFRNQPAAFLESQFLALSAGTVPEPLREAALALALWFDDPAGDASALDPVGSAEATLAVLAATGLSLDALDERDHGEVEALARAAAVMAAGAARAHDAPPRDERAAPEADDGLTVIRVVPDPPAVTNAQPPLPGASSAHERATLSPPALPETEAMRDPAPPEPPARSETRMTGETAAALPRRVKPGGSPMMPEAALRAKPRIAIAVEPSRHPGLSPFRPADAPPVKASIQVASAPRPSSAASATSPRQAAIAERPPIRAAATLDCGASTAIPPRRVVAAPPAPCASPIGEPSPIRAAAPSFQGAPGAMRLAGAASTTLPPRRAAIAPPAPAASAPAMLDARLARLLALVTDPADRGDRPAEFEALLPADDWI